MSRPILALDQGTTSSRAIVYAADGTILGQAQREFAQIYPRAGWVEHDPMVVLESQFVTAHDALRAANLRGRDIAAIGITNQRETSVLWERSSGKPIGNAIVWQDRRSADLCHSMHDAGHAALFAARTGLVLDPYFSASKIAWMLSNMDGLRARAERGEIAFGTIDSWLVWHLSAGRTHVTDASNAARTLLFDIHRGEWDDELLALWNIPRAVLPDVVASSGVCATTSTFGGEIPLAGIAGDQQAALFGQACFEPGMAKCTYGTGCFILMNTGTRAATSRSGLLTTIAWQINGTIEYALEGSVFMGGATVQWLRDGLGVIAHASEVEDLAASVASSEGVVLVPAFTGLGAPYWDPHARALLIGMTRGTTRAHVARAALDAIAWQVADVAACMQTDATLVLRELRVDGGAASNNLLLQIQADALGVSIARSHRVESTAFGAALLAGLGVGIYRNRAETGAAWQLAKRFEPVVDVPTRERSRALWQRAVGRARDWEL